MPLPPVPLAAQQPFLQERGPGGTGSSLAGLGRDFSLLTWLLTG